MRPARGGEFQVGETVFQKAAVFSLRGIDRDTVLKGIPLAYEIRRIEGDRLYLTAMGLKGWAPASAVVLDTEAEAFFSAAIASKPSDSVAHLVRGIVRLHNKQAGAIALADVNEAVRLDPKSAFALLARGFLRIDFEPGITDRRKIHQERLEAGLRDLEDALRLDPTNPCLLMCRAEARAAVEQTDQALADYEAAIALDSTLTEAHAGKARLLVEKGEFVKALAELETTIRIDPDDPDHHLELGRCWMYQNETEKAFAEINEAIRLDARHSEALRERAFSGS